MSEVGVVAIGRNEGERLRRCLDALAGLGATVVYVDSDSTDESVALARERGVEVVELDMSLPVLGGAGAERGVRAAVARSIRRCDSSSSSMAIARSPTAGLSAVAASWRTSPRPLSSSVAATSGSPSARSTTGWPTSSGIYRSPAGRATRSRGVRRRRDDPGRGIPGRRRLQPLDPAGEEPELCQRLRGAGYSVVRLDADMTWHDSAMLRFRQWARRQFRTGYGGLDFATRFGRRGERSVPPPDPQRPVLGAGLAAGLDRRGNRRRGFWRAGCRWVDRRTRGARPACTGGPDRSAESNAGGQSWHGLGLRRPDDGREVVPAGRPVSLCSGPARRPPCPPDRVQVCRFGARAGDLLIPQGAEPFDARPRLAGRPGTLPRTALAQGAVDLGDRRLSLRAAESTAARAALCAAFATGSTGWPSGSPRH